MNNFCLSQAVSALYSFIFFFEVVLSAPYARGYRGWAKSKICVRGIKNLTIE